MMGDAHQCATLVELLELDDGEPFVSILCRGDHGSWGGFQFMELSFEVQFIVLGEVFTTQNPAVTQQHLPAQFRAEILPMVARCYAAILEKFRPGFVYRACAHPNLPEEALEKHHFLTRAIIACGYYKGIASDVALE
ncbi:hypothetical protein [Bradyrhizobium sp. CSS354]|uniref:hypothetical protein n=1 Tax=Bradyrhizobium sp. CSS354 TaxID=2699172 RepID=UPI0023AFDD78|nr:hypothetical protein [Bradyrhizobium sp. CSS354]MDE5461797.1 hypothetical protein [Bradyrhizobium sp. CSS354]